MAPSRVRLGTQARSRTGAPLRLWIVRGYTASDVCLTIQLAGRTLATACGGPTGVVLGPASELRRGGVVIGGLGARSATRVRLRLAGGRSLIVPAHAGAWVAELPPGARLVGRPEVPPNELTGTVSAVDRIARSS